jgi:IclR family acetate operon transcriptional repressor
MRKREPGLQSLDRGLEILDLLAERAYTVEDLSRRLRCPKSTTYRTLATLRRRSLVDRDARQGRYRVGYGVLRFSRGLSGRSPLREAAVGTLRAIAADLRETALLTVRTGNVGVVVESIESAEPVRVAPALGESTPLHCGAPMKALLAFLPDDEIDAYLLRKLERLTPHSIADPKRLRAHLAAIRQRGYAESREEVYPGAVGVAVPVLGGERRPLASLGVGAPVHRCSPQRVEAIAQRLRQAARELARRARGA